MDALSLRRCFAWLLAFAWLSRLLTFARHRWLSLGILSRIGIRILAGRIGNFARQLIRQIFDFILRASQRFCLAAEHRVGRFFDSLSEIFDPLASDLFGLLPLIPQPTTHQNFRRLQRFFRFLFACLANGVIQPPRHQWLAVFGFFHQLLRLIQNAFQIVALLSYLFLQTFAIAIVS